MVNPELQFHKHTGTDSPKINGRDLENSPQPTPTTSVIGTLTSEGSSNLKTVDQLILVNMQTRINELETILRNLGVII